MSLKTVPPASRVSSNLSLPESIATQNTTSFQQSLEFSSDGKSNDTDEAWHGSKNYENSGDFFISEDGDVIQVILNRNVNEWDEEEFNTPGKKKQYRSPEVVNLLEEFQKILKEYNDSGTESIPDDVLPIQDETEEVVKIQSEFSIDFEYRLNHFCGHNSFLTLIKLATYEFLSINELRGKLCYIQDLLGGEITNLSIEPEKPLSRLSAWIWMCAEIIHLFKSSSDVLQDPSALIKCESLIHQELVSISKQLKALKADAEKLDTSWRKFKLEFIKIDSGVRRRFSEAISVDVENLRGRFLEESEARSVEYNPILSPSTPILKSSVKEVNQEFLGWGLDGLCMKTQGFVLLSVAKTNSTHFLSVMHTFFDGFNSYLRRGSWCLKSSFTTLSTFYEIDKNALSKNLMTLAELSKNIGYIYPTEQSRAVHAVWQIQRVIEEGLDLTTQMTDHLEISNALWKDSFGKEEKVNRIQKQIKVSLQPFLDWKFCRGLTFQLSLNSFDPPKQNGSLSLMVPNKCSNIPPLIFQIIENLLCALVDFRDEYNHRIERLSDTRTLLESDAQVCCDSIQHMYYNSFLICEILRKSNENTQDYNRKISRKKPVPRRYHYLNIWFFICTECILLIKSSNIENAQKEVFRKQFETCFSTLKRLLKLVDIAGHKYDHHLRKIWKAQSTFQRLIATVSKSIPPEENTQTRNDEFEQNDTSSSSSSPVINVSLHRSGFYIEYAESRYNLRSIPEPFFTRIIQTFLKHLQNVLDEGVGVYLDSVKLITSTVTEDEIEDKVVPGIRVLIQEIHDEFQNQKMNLNPLDVLVGSLSLDNLKTCFSDTTVLARDVLLTRKALFNNLEYPLQVLKFNSGKGWPKRKLKYSCVADYVSGPLRFPIYEPTVVNELKELLSTIEDLSVPAIDHKHLD